MKRPGQRRWQNFRLSTRRRSKRSGELNAAIFDVQSMMLDDDDFNDAVRNLMESQKVNAEYAVAVTGDNFAKMFSEMDDEYFKARSADIKDVSERVVKLLHGKGRRCGKSATSP